MIRAWDTFFFFKAHLVKCGVLDLEVLCQCCLNVLLPLTSFGHRGTFFEELGICENHVAPGRDYAADGPKTNSENAAGVHRLEEASVWASIIMKDQTNLCFVFFFALSGTMTPEGIS